VQYVECRARAAAMVAISNRLRSIAVRTVTLSVFHAWATSGPGRERGRVVGQEPPGGPLLSVVVRQRARWIALWNHIDEHHASVRHRCHVRPASRCCASWRVGSPCGLQG
jgi:hypothetical protein